MKTFSRHLFLSLAVLVWSSLACGGEIDEMFVAVWNGRSEKVRALLRDHPELVSTKITNGHTPLHDAAYRGHENVVELLLAKGADVNAKGNSDRTPLHNAASGSKPNVARLLLTKGAKVNARMENGYTPLYLAARHGPRSVAELLLANGADVNARDDDGATPLHQAAEYGHKDVAELLLAKGADVNIKCSDKGWTPLHQAIFYGHLDVARLLLAHKAEYTIFDVAGAGDLEKVKALLKDHPELVFCREKEDEALVTDTQACTPLYIAAKYNHIDIVEFLLAKGAEVNARNE